MSAAVTAPQHTPDVSVRRGLTGEHTVAFPVQIPPTKHWSERLAFCPLKDLFCLSVYLPEESDRNALQHSLACSQETETDALVLCLRDETHTVPFPPRVLPTLVSRVACETGVCFLVPQDYTFAHATSVEPSLEAYVSTEGSMSCAWIDSQNTAPKNALPEDAAPLDVIDTQEPIVHAVPNNATFGYREMCTPSQIPDLDRANRIPELAFPNWIVHHVRHHKSAYANAVKDRATFTAWIVQQYVQENRLLDPAEIRSLVWTIEAIYREKANAFVRNLWANQAGAGSS